MKRAMWGATAAIFLVGGLAGCSHMGVSKEMAKEDSTSQTQLAPTLVVVNPVKLEKDVKVVIIGAGFQPGQELFVLFKGHDGVLTNIGYALKPDPVPNSQGAWTATWTCGDHLREDIREGVYTLAVSTPDYRFLAHAPVAFYKQQPEGKPEKK